MASRGSQGVAGVEAQDEEAFAKELRELLSRHNKSIEDVKGETPSETQAGTPEGIQKQIVEHIHRLTGTQVSHKRLRTFSGRVPVPHGELPFDVWFQQADQLVQETSLTDEEKRCRLSECLMPPALTLFRKAAKELGPSARTEDLLGQLVQAFGVACEGDDLVSLFRETFQEPNEKPSAYLTRLEERLDQAIQYGGVHQEEADGLRISQFIRGCIFDDGVISNLQLRQRRTQPPGLITLLQEVRMEEASKAARSARRQQSKSARKAQTNSLEAQQAATELQLEVSKLKAQLAAMQTSAVAPTPVTPETSPLSTPSLEEGLRKEVAKLRQELSSLKGSDKHKQNKGPSGRRLICFRCGMAGHMARGCQNPQMLH